MGLTQVGCALLLLYQLQCSLCCLAPSPPPPTTPPSPPPPTSPPPTSSPAPGAVTEEQSPAEFCAAYTSSSPPLIVPPNRQMSAGRREVTAETRPVVPVVESDTGSVLRGTRTSAAQPSLSRRIPALTRGAPVWTSKSLSD